MKYRALSEVSTITMGQSPDSSSYNERKEGLPFFQGNADFGEIHPQVRVWCAEPKKTAQKDDILISVRAPIGALNIADRQCCIGRGLASVRVNESVCDRKFLWYALKSKVEELISKGTGSTFKAIGKNVLMSIAIPDIELKDQSTISNKLDIITILINKSKKQLENLDELVKSRFVEMFGDMLINPFDWKLDKLGKVCDVRDGTHDSPSYHDEGYPLVTSKNVTNGAINFNDCNLICESDFIKINERSKVDMGDIIMPMIGTIGKPVIVDTNKPFAIKNVALIKFYPNGLVNNTYIHTILKSDYFDRMVISKIRGGTQKFIALGDIRELTICIPPLEIQNQFSDFVVKVERQKATVQKSIDKLETLKKSLMQEYFG